MSPDDSIELAIQHARELFIYHAGQRIQSLNFYFVAIAVFLTGFGFVATAKMTDGVRALFGIVLAIAGIYITKLFQDLDKRNEQLVHCDEKLLKAAEQKMVGTVIPEWNITECYEQQKDGVPHYVTVVPNIFKLYIGLSAVGGIYSVVPWISHFFCV